MQGFAIDQWLLWSIPPNLESKSGATPPTFGLRLFPFTTSKEYLINCHILLQYSKLLFLQLQLVQILCKLIIIWVNYEKTKNPKGSFLRNTVYMFIAVVIWRQLLRRWLIGTFITVHQYEPHVVTLSSTTTRYLSTVCFLSCLFFVLFFFLFFFGYFQSVKSPNFNFWLIWLSLIFLIYLKPAYSISEKLIS